MLTSIAPNHCYGVGTVIVYDAIVSRIILKVINILVGPRVTKEVEREGLHGEVVQHQGPTSAFGTGSTGNVPTLGRPRRERGLPPFAS
jgi:hypothetical protein